MKIKKLSLALGLLLALPSIGLISCSKKKEGYTVKVSVTDIGTARAYYLDTLKTENNKGDIVSKLDVNKNGAKITHVKVTYIDEKGKKIEDRIQSLEVGKEFEKTYQVAAGKTIIVTAEAEGTPVADTTHLNVPKTANDLKDKYKVKKAWETVEGAGGKYWLKKATAELEKLENQVYGQPIEVTLPTLSIEIDKGGETIAAQSVKASKSTLKPEELTKVGEKTTVTATATAVAFDVK